MKIQEAIYLPVPTLPVDASDSDTCMVEEEMCLKRLVLLPEGTSCVKHTEEMEFYVGWLAGFF